MSQNKKIGTILGSTLYKKSCLLYEDRIVYRKSINKINITFIYGTAKQRRSYNLQGGDTRNSTLLVRLSSCFSNKCLIMRKRRAFLITVVVFFCFVSQTFGPQPRVLKLLEIV